MQGNGELVNVVIHKGEAGEEHLPSAMSVGWTTGQHVLLQKTTDPAQTCMSQKKDSEVQLPTSSQTTWPQSRGARLIPARVNVSLCKSKMTASNAVVRARLNTRPALGLKANPRQLGRA